VEAIPTGLEKEEIAETTSGQALNRINELFALDKELAELPVAERQQERLRLEKDKLEALFMWLKTVQPETAPKSALGKAVNYVLNHQEGLSVYLLHGAAAMSNNICERAIRNFTIGRKNWLFSGSPKGAAASAAAYSMIETSKANGLDPFKYLTYLCYSCNSVNHFSLSYWRPVRIVCFVNAHYFTVNHAKNNIPKTNDCPIFRFDSRTILDLNVSLLSPIASLERRRFISNFDSIFTVYWLDT
jgi:hypothetical protein